MQVFRLALLAQDDNLFWGEQKLRIRKWELDSLRKPSSRKDGIPGNARPPWLRSMQVFRLALLAQDDKFWGKQKAQDPKTGAGLSPETFQ